MDAANVDLKAFTERFYKKLTGSSLEPVLDTIKYLKHETDIWFELTTLLIPGENDSEEEITNMVDWVQDNIGTDVPLHFTAFHPDFKMMDHPHTPPETLSRARAASPSTPASATPTPATPSTRPARALTATNAANS